MSEHNDRVLAHTKEAIANRLSESNQQQSHLKDSILGAIDGAVTTFAVVSSVAGAGLPSSIIVVMGLANLFADGFSMAAGNFTGTRAENQSARRHRRQEIEEIAQHPEGEKEEIRQIYAAKGFQGELLEEVVRVITSEEKRWVDTMLQEEHGLSLKPVSGLKSAVATFAAFLLIGAIPLIAFLLQLIGWEVAQPFMVSCVLTGISFFVIGAYKSRFVDQHWLSGGLETLGIGGVAASIAYGVGYLLRAFMPEGMAL